MLKIFQSHPISSKNIYCFITLSKYQYFFLNFRSERFMHSFLDSFGRVKEI